MNKQSSWIFFILLALICIAVLYTYPLAVNMSSRLPGFEQSDTYLSVWNIWHLKKAIIEGADFFGLTTTYIFYPQHPSLFLHNYIITSGLLSLPFQLLFTPLVSMNLVFFMQFILTGLGMYLLVLYYTRGKLAALWAAVTLAFCPYVIIQSCYFLHFSSVWFFPWFIYLFWRFLNSGRLQFGIGAAIVYALCLFEDQTYFVFLSMLAVLLIIFIAYRKRRIPSKRFIRNSVLSGGLFLCLGSWYLAGLLGKTLTAHTGFPIWPDTVIDYFSLHASGLLRPSPLLTLYHQLPYICTPIKHITNVFVGYVPLFFACLALTQFRKLAAEKRNIIMFWTITGILFYLLASGPKLFGNDQILNKFAPYNLVCVGPLRQLRIPVRFTLITLISVYIVAAFGIGQFVRMKKRILRSASSVGLFLIIVQIIEFLPMPYPLLDLTAPRVYTDLVNRDKSTPILVLPMGWQSSYRTVGHYAKEIQYYQTIHGHPIFQGQIARIEDSYFDYYTSQPGFRYLIEADRRFPTAEEKSALYGLLRKYGIKHVIIHTSYFDQKHLSQILEILKTYPVSVQTL